MSRVVYVVERREFETLEAARAFARRFFERDRTVVAITERKKRVKK